MTVTALRVRSHAICVAAAETLTPINQSGKRTFGAAFNVVLLARSCLATLVFVTMSCTTTTLASDSKITLHTC